MDDVFEFLGYVARRFVNLCKTIQKAFVDTFFPTRIPPRPSNPRLPRRPSSSSPSRKKFQIIDQTTQPLRFIPPPPPPPPLRFTPPTPLRFTKVRKTTRFTHITETRPQKCPCCLTNFQLDPSLIANSDGQWCCKICDEKW